MNPINSDLQVPSPHLNHHLLSTNKEDVALDPFDWNSDAHLFDMLFNLLVDFLIWSWGKWHCGIEEELLTLLVNLLVGVSINCLVKEGVT